MSAALFISWLLEGTWKGRMQPNEQKAKGVRIQTCKQNASTLYCPMHRNSFNSSGTKFLL